MMLRGGRGREGKREKESGFHHPMRMDELFVDREEGLSSLWTG